MSFFSCLFMFISCKKESKQQTLKEVLPKQADNQFQKCDCSVSNSVEFEAQYIKAELNGVAMCFDVAPNFDSNFANMFKYGILTKNSEKIFYDNTHLIRSAKNSPWQIAIFLENTHALTKTYPYNLPRQNPEVCEIGELQINYNYATKFYNPFWGNGMRLTVNNFNNGYFEGTFNGTAVAKSGEIVKVSNGMFKIKLAIENKDFEVNF